MLNNMWKRTSLSFKAALLLVALLSTGVGVALGAKAATAASLKSVSVITGDVLRVSDIFDNVQRNGDYVIGAAPQPGHDMTLNARTLYRIAMALDLEWRPSTAADQVTIRREAQVVSSDTIHNAIKKELNSNGVEGLFEIDLNTGEPSIVLPKDLPAMVEVTEFFYDNQKDYFRATLAAPSADNAIKTLSLSGLVDRQTMVPVLRNAMTNGDIIHENDIDMIPASEKSLQHGVILNKEDMIGMTPRRMAHGGKFLLATMLERPQLVERGESVTITFRQGPLTLTAKGKALQSGAKGDIVRVTNVASAKTIDATVNDTNSVIVQ
jgi:flagella basal body P-ring formation protein FlgA